MKKTINNEAFIKKYFDENNCSTAKSNYLKTQTDSEKLAKSLVHFVFRNGVIEDMHADKTKNITDEDMKVLNKYMMDRMYYFIELLREDKWLEIEYLKAIFEIYGSDWDAPERIDEETLLVISKEAIISRLIKNIQV